MGTLTSLMDLAQQSLLADQSALNVTSNNVANQNTAGYTREVVSWQPSDAVTLSGTLFNGGITTTAASQRDRVLEQRVHQQTQAQAQSGALESALQQVENIFGLSATASSASSTALGTAMDSFFSSLSALTANPSDAATRQSVLSAANALASSFNSASNQITQIASSINQQISSAADRVNGLTATIASLNQQIGSVSPDKDAGALEDQRQLAIAQLSQYVGLDQISTENNGISLTMSNGAVLVSGNQSFVLQASPVAASIHLFDTTGKDVTAGIVGGQVAALIQVRDRYLPDYMSALDSLASAIGTQVNQQNALGLDGNGNPGGALFTWGAKAAATIAVATNDPKAIAAASVGEGSAGSGNAQALADLATSAIVGGETASGYYAALLGQIGSDASEAATDNSAQQAALAQLTTQRNSLSGVSLDEEAANLTQYQRSYEAAAKMFTIADRLTADALNLGVQSAVS